MVEHYIGIDVSKLHFDAALMRVINHQKGAIVKQRFENNADGLVLFGKWMKSHKSTPETTLLVMENTGVYHRLLWGFCSKISLPVHIGNAAHIKWSLGITRGKDDRTDSMRLCQYACKEADALKAAPTLHPDMLQLKDLYTSRARLLAQFSGNKVYLKELKNVSPSATQKALEASYKSTLEGQKKSIKLLEAQIKLLLDQNQELNANYKLLVSVPGIGHITAVYLLCCTCNFISRPTGKQLASYAGVAPFGYTSGSSIRRKDHVHKMANKELKKLLFMGAMSAIQYNAELRLYYERKMGEGKHGWSALNAVKNKMLLRVAAVVNNQRPFVDNFQKAA